MSQVPLLATKKLLSSPSLSPSQLSALTFVKSVRLWVSSQDWIGWSDGRSGVTLDIEVEGRPEQAI